MSRLGALKSGPSASYVKSKESTADSNPSFLPFSGMPSTKLTQPSFRTFHLQQRIKCVRGQSRMSPEVLHRPIFAQSRRVRSSRASIWERGLLYYDVRTKGEMGGGQEILKTLYILRTKSGGGSQKILTFCERHIWKSPK